MDMQHQRYDTDRGKLQQRYSDHRNLTRTDPVSNPCFRGERPASRGCVNVSISKRPKRRGAKNAAHVIVTATGIRRVATISIVLNTKLTAAQHVDNRTQITGATGLLVSGRYGIQHRTQLDPKIQTLVGDIIHPCAYKFMELLRLEKGDNDITSPQISAVTLGSNRLQVPASKPIHKRLHR